MKIGSSFSFLFPRDGFGTKGAQVSLTGWVSAGSPAWDAVCIQSGDPPVCLAQANLQRVLLAKMHGNSLKSPN